ncbi:MAG: flippase-like domain-containing protein [Saprospiraceae bacterium]|nr:flippase-like domain-containing protein [Saprospiraceae bacterium]
MNRLRLVFLLLVLLLLGFFVRNLDWQKAIASLHQLGFRFVWLLLVTGAGYVCATVGWRYCMGDSGKSLSVKGLFLVRQVGEAVSFIQPTSAVGGEAMKIFMLRRQAVNPATLIAAAFVSRTGMFLAQAVLFFISSIGSSMFLFQLSDSMAGTGAWLAGVAVFIGLIGYRRFLLRWLQHLAQKRKWAERLVHVSTQLAQGWQEWKTSIRNNPQAFLLAMLFFMLYWVIDSMELWLILHFLETDISPVHAVMFNTGVAFYKAAAGFIPGQIGVEELANKVMLDQMVAPGHEDLWLTVSLIRRARQLCWIVFGVVVYWRGER